MEENLFLLLALVVVITMLFLSGRRRRKAADELRNRVVKGAYVMLTSGIFGKVTQIADDRIELETAPGQKLTVAIGAVRSIEEEKKMASPKKASASTKSTSEKPKTASKATPKKK